MTITDVGGEGRRAAISKGNSAGEQHQRKYQQNVTRHGGVSIVQYGILLMDGLVVGLIIRLIAWHNEKARHELA